MAIRGRQMEEKSEGRRKGGSGKVSEVKVNET